MPVIHSAVVTILVGLFATIVLLWWAFRAEESDLVRAGTW